MMEGSNIIFDDALNQDSFRSRFLNNMLKFLQENLQFKKVLQIYGNIELTIDDIPTIHFQIPRILVEVQDKVKTGSDIYLNYGGSSNIEIDDYICPSPIFDDGDDDYSQPKSSKAKSVEPKSKQKKPRVANTARPRSKPFIPRRRVEYECRVCSFNHVSGKVFREHMLQRHGVEKAFKCTECDYECTSACSLNRHLATKHDRPSYSLPKLKCTDCDFTTAYPYRLKAHISLIHGTGVGSFKCNACNFRCNSYDRLSLHRSKSHEKRRMFNCRLKCGYQSNKMSEVIRHQQIKHHGEGLFKCPLSCGRSFLEMAKMRIHLKENHATAKELCCDKCDYKTNFSASLLQHKKLKHTDRITVKSMQKYKCSKCNYTTGLRSTFEKHKSRHDESGQFVCEICSYRYQTSSALASHMNTHKHEYHQCELCKETFDKYEAFHFHLETVHNAMLSFGCSHSECTFSTSDHLDFKKHCLEAHQDHKGFQCEKCKKRFKTYTALGKHMYGHFHEDEVQTPLPEVRSYSCDVCERKFKVKGDWNNHVKSVHFADETFLCAQCDFKTIFEVNLWYHEKTNHSVANPFKCKECAETFSQISSLNQHSEEEHELLGLKCHLCDYRDSVFLGLKQHFYKNHSNVKLYECIFCDKIFASRASRETHIRNIHPNIKCDSCNIMFPNISGLKKHVDELHDGNYEVSNNKSESDAFGKCEKCGFEALFEFSLMSHLDNIHKITNTYKCSECSKCFFTMSSLKVHMKSVHDLLAYKCHKCEFRGDTLQDLSEHFDLAHNNSVINFETCDICNKVVKKTALKRHKLTHTKKETCDKCSKTFAKVDDLKQHSMIEHSENCFQCDICRRAFTTDKGRDQHLDKVHSIKQTKDKSKKTADTSASVDLSTSIEMSTSLGNDASGVKNNDSSIKNSVCKLCEEVFTSFEDLKEHVDEMHDGKLEAITAKSKDDYFGQCQQCGYDAQFETSLMNHLCDVHKIKDVYKCSECTQRYSQMKSLKLHMKKEHDLLAFACHKCEFRAENFKDLNKHFDLTHSGHVIVNCSICDKAIKEINMRKHMKDVHSKQKTHECGKCKKKFVKLDDFNQHISIEHSFKCNFCDHTFVSEDCRDEHHKKLHLNLQATDILSKNTEDHKEIIGHECNECSETFETLSELNLHSVSEHSNDVFKCHLCDRQFLTKKGREMHLSIVHSIKPERKESGDNITCQLCEKHFTEIKSLKAHAKENHDKNLSDALFCKGDKNHYGKCGICGFSALFQITLINHFYKFHKINDVFECSECGKCYSKMESLKPHMKQEHNLFAFACHNCDYRGETFSNLSGHFNQEHTELSSKMAACEICNIYVSKPYLVRHKREKHTLTDVHKCTKCDKTFAKIDDLSQHLITEHHEGKIYVCRKCDRKFTTSSGRNKHMRNNHGKTKPSGENESKEMSDMEVDDN